MLAAASYRTVEISDHHYELTAKKFIHTLNRNNVHAMTVSMTTIMTEKLINNFLIYIQSNTPANI